MSLFGRLWWFGVCFGGFLISGGFVGFAWLCLFNGFVAGLSFAVLCCMLFVILLVAVFVG